MNKSKLLLSILMVLITFQKGFCQMEEVGNASFYSDNLEGRSTASGELYQKNKMTAAHRTLAFGTRIKVTNLKNHKTVIVRVNDRGPFVKDRIVDLSKAAAEKLNFIDSGIANVSIEVLND